MKIEEMIPRNLDQLLSELGLQKRQSSSDLILPAIGLFAVGAIVGGMVGLMLAPSSGRELRGELEKKLRAGTDGVDHEPRRETSASPQHSAS